MTEQGGLSVRAKSPNPALLVVSQTTVDVSRRKRSHGGSIAEWFRALNSMR